MDGVVSEQADKPIAKINGSNRSRGSERMVIPNVVWLGALFRSGNVKFRQRFLKNRMKIDLTKIQSEINRILIVRPHYALRVRT